MTVAVQFKDVDVVFGKETATALAMLDSGSTRSEIQKDTGAVLACAGVNLTVRQGEISVLMGLSGSGKSSLLRTVNGLNPVTRGQVEVQFGERKVDVPSCSPAELMNIRRQATAMVFQQFALLPWRTVEENVALGLEIAGSPIAERKRCIDSQLELVGLAGWGQKLVHELSGGMQQRVGLARAFATAAPLLLMDEPFSALDPLIRAKLQAQLLQLQKHLKKSIIFVSHDLEEALRIGNTISIMVDGRIVQTGTPEEIVLRPKNGYVRDFVAHVNPLSIITAANMMRTREQLEQEDGGVWLDADKTAHIRFGPQGIIATRRDGTSLRWLSVDSIEALPSASPCVLSAKPETPISSIAKAIPAANGAPVAIVDSSENFVGAIDCIDVLRAISR